MDRLVVKELIQQDLNIDNLKAELNNILADSPARKKMQSDFKELKKKLGGEGASAKAAEIILSEL